MPDLVGLRNIFTLCLQRVPRVPFNPAKLALVPVPNPCPGGSCWGAELQGAGLGWAALLEAALLGAPGSSPCASGVPWVGTAPVSLPCPAHPSQFFREQDFPRGCSSVPGTPLAAQPTPNLAIFCKKPDLYRVKSSSPHPSCAVSVAVLPLWCPFSVRGAMYSLCVTSACLEELRILGTVCWLKTKTL